MNGFGFSIEYFGKLNFEATKIIVTKETMHIITDAVNPAKLCLNALNEKKDLSTENDCKNWMQKTIKTGKTASNRMNAIMTIRATHATALRATTEERLTVCID